MTREEGKLMSKWISVEERLPRSVNNKVLVWKEHDDLGGYIGFAYYEKYYGKELWWDLERDERFDKRGWRVTYWMPLPEPPGDYCDKTMAQANQEPVYPTWAEWLRDINIHGMDTIPADIAERLGIEPKGGIR